MRIFITIIISVFFLFANTGFASDSKMPKVNSPRTGKVFGPVLSSNDEDEFRVVRFALSFGTATLVSRGGKILDVKFSEEMDSDSRGKTLKTNNVFEDQNIVVSEFSDEKLKLMFIFNRAKRSLQVVPIT